MAGAAGYCLSAFTHENFTRLLHRMGVTISQLESMRAVAFIGSVLAVLASAPCQTYTQKLVSRYVAHSDAIPNDLDWSKGLVVAGKVTWVVSPEGLGRKEPDAAARDRTQFFAGRRYLPEGEIMAVADDHAGGIWVRTRDGVSHIEMHPMTLEQKAQFFERRVHERHDRYGLVASSTLTEPGNLKSNRLTPSDNDGLWTAMYAAAECFRYAVTRSPEALANARKSVEAVLFLERVTGRAGFPARSYIREGDWRPTDGVWHWTADGHYEWKADTSSDEIVGHFFIFSIAHDLLPDGDLKRRIDATARRIMDHILEHGYHLADIDGKPTTWGKWSRMYFDGAGRSDSALNAVELLSFLKTTHHITGDPKYDREYRKAALDLGYAEQGTRYLELRTEINYSDEELAMLSFTHCFSTKRVQSCCAITVMRRGNGGRTYRGKRTRSGP